jgi:hypothetical protein
MPQLVFRVVFSCAGLRAASGFSTVPAQAQPWQGFSMTQRSAGIAVFVGLVEGRMV